MALEFDDKYRTIIHNRTCVFENGNPVNKEHWEKFKKLANDLLNNWKSGSSQWTAISERMISECFNKIVDPMSGYTLRSSFDQFEIYCEQLGIDYKHDDEYRHYLVRFDPLKNIVAK